jgi:outer membrane protein assembly factor BamB
MDYRTLGYPNFNEIPGDAAFITALAAGPDQIYGATSGVQSYLFVYAPNTNRVKPLGRLGDAQGVHHSLAVDAAGIVYIGTGKNLLKSFTIKPDLSFGLNHISQDLWTQVKEHYSGYAGGHILRYDPSAEPKTSKPDQPAIVKDLGVPVAGDGIYCMTLDPNRQVLYGITYPRAHFFLYDLKAGRMEDKGPIFKDVLFGGPDDRTLRTLPRNLVVADGGDVYTSTDDGYLLRFDVVAGELKTLKARLPGEAMQVVEAWIRDGAILYGGTSEGFLFRFSPGTGEVENLGKPMISQRIRGLALGADRMLYGLAGDRSLPNLLFRFDTQKRRYDVLGGVAADRSPLYLWRGQQFDAMVAGADGTIFMGENDRGGHLFFYIP